MPKKIILDCDPGVDDALAITYAVGSAELELVGITTVAGNVGLDKTTGNALRLREFLGVPGIPVTAGCARPLLREPGPADQVHGLDGLGHASLPDPVAGPEPGHAIDFIIDTVTADPGAITLVATGPLTNIALALRREPALASRVRDFVIMGGSVSRGNMTPAAEFNIFADPEAAAVVFSAGWTVTMVGLDVTLRAIAHEKVIARLGQLGGLAEHLLLPSLRGYIEIDPDATTLDGHAITVDPAVHDVCAVAYVASPQLLSCRPARVEIETTGQWTTGMTVADFGATPDRCNALVATGIDVAAFWQSVHEAFGRVQASRTG